MRMRAVLLLFLAACAPNERELYATSASEVQGGLAIGARTPNAVTWTWDAATLAPGAAGCVLWYGTDEADVRASAASEWSAANDPNLAWGDSPYGVGLVQRTTVTDLAPDTRYFALLWARLGNDSRPIAFGEATTAVPLPGEVAIFTEDQHQAAGSWILGFDPDPSSATRTHSGNAALWLHTTETHNPVNGQLGALGIDTTGIPAAAWPDAYLELFAVLSSDARPVPDIHVHLVSHDGVEYRYTDPAYAVLTVRPDWQPIQIPLSSMESPGGTLASDMPTKIDGFLFGAHWDVEDIVWVDDVIIRY